MPIYLLGARTPRLEIPRQAMTASISGAVSGAALYVDGAAANHDVVGLNAHLLVLPAISEPLIIGVRPVGMPSFQHGTVVHLVLGPDSTDLVDPVQVTFDAVDVSGSGATELVSLRPHGSRFEVEVCTVADTPLGPLASLARTAARRRGGAKQRQRHGSLTVAVDTSASMVTSFADGSVATAVDTIVGVADVAGIAEVSVVLVGATGTPVVAPHAELAAAVGRSPVRWSAGARWSVLPADHRTIVVTDSANAPNRFPALRITTDSTSTAGGPVLRPPPRGVSADRHLAGDPAALDQLAAALLRVLAC